MKHTIIFIFITIAFISCNTSRDNKIIENSQRTDSLLKIINSPELAAINKKILKNPNDPDFYNERAKIYLQFNQMEDAVSDAKRAIRMDSTNVEYYLTEADVFFAANETRNAKDVLEKVVIQFPENTDGLLKLSELYFLVKQYENAFVGINKALKINQNLAKAYYLKGSIYKEMGDTTKAVSSLETAIEQDTKNYNAFLDLGLIYGAKKNPLAFEYYNNAITINPTSPEALYAKAKLLQDLEKYDDAVVLYNQILKINPAHTFSLYNMGAIEFSVKKQTLKAIDYFSKSVDSQPNYAEAYYARGACYQELNDKNNALADYNMCLQLKKNFEPAIDGINSLAKKK